VKRYLRITLEPLTSEVTSDVELPDDWNDWTVGERENFRVDVVSQLIWKNIACDIQEVEKLGGDRC